MQIAIKLSDNVLLDAVKSLDDNCSIYSKYKKLKSRPVVKFLLEHDFNKAVAKYLKQFKNIYILHLIDHATRFTVEAIIHSKGKEAIIDKIFKHWIALFGTPNLFLSNNLGEFNNDVF